MSALDRIRNKLAQAGNIVRRGLLDGGVSADFTVAAKGAGDDGFDAVEFWQTFGLASRPPVGGEVVLECPYNAGEGAIVTAHHDRKQVPIVGANEVVIYGYKSGSLQGMQVMKTDGAIHVIPAVGKVVDIGTAGTSVDYLLLGTTFDVSNRVLVLAVQTWATACFTGFTAIGTGFGAAGTAFTALGADGALGQPAKDACNTAATAMGVAVTACGVAAAASTAAASACGVFLAGTYLAIKAMVT